MPEITMENVELSFRSEEPRQPTVKLVEERLIEMAKTVITNVPDCQSRKDILYGLQGIARMCATLIKSGGK